MSKPAITDLPIWAQAAQEEHKHKKDKDKTHGKGHTADGGTGDPPDPNCCTPIDPDPGPDGG